MWLKRLYSFRSASEIRDYSKTQRAFRGKGDVRASINIAVIDDEKLQARPNLTTYGYRITELPDIRSVQEIENYDVILCDLMGVGKNFDQSIGGSSIIREIKQNYPTKVVIAYTGARSNTTEAVTAREFADDFLKKDAEISRWVEKLDEAIEVASDPYKRWIVARQGLIDEEVDLRKIVELESAYVDSIVGKDNSFSRLKDLSSSLEIGSHSKSIIQGLVSSAIYSFIFSS